MNSKLSRKQNFGFSKLLAWGKGILFGLVGSSGLIKRKDKIKLTEVEGGDLTPLTLTRCAIIAAGLAGAAGLIIEVVATKALSYFFHANTYSVASVLAVFLIGLAIGAYFISLLITKIRPKRHVFAGIQMVIGLYALFILPRFDGVPLVMESLYRWTGSHPWFLLPSKVLTSFLYLGLPTVLMGASLPLIISLVITRLDEVGRKVSVVYFFDLVGSVLGVFLAGFILLPKYGISVAYSVGGIISFCAAFFILVGDRKEMWKIAAVGGGAVLCAGIFMNPFNAEAVLALEERSGFVFEKHFDHYEVLFKKHSPYGEVRVIKDSPKAQGLTLYINKRDQCDTRDCISERVIVQKTLKRFKNKKLIVLNVGLGAGVALKEIVQDQRVERVDVVEINPVIVEAQKYFAPFNDHVLENEKVNIIVDDGYRYMAGTKKVYDAIVVDVENPKIAHSSPLYTVEYFRNVAKSLTSDGVFGLWAYSGGDAYVSILYHSLKTSFNHVYLIQYGDAYHNLFICSKSPMDPDRLGLTESDIRLTQRIQQRDHVKLNTLNHMTLADAYDWLGY